MGLAEIYNYYNTENADKRTNDWLLVSSPVPILILSVLYLYFILDYGPKYMKNRKPYSLKTFIQWYNIFQIVSNALIVYHSFDAGWYTDGYMHCTKVEFYTRNAIKMTRIGWYVLSLKIIDYIETILFVLRKKDEQISFLHLYHHVSMVILTWMAVKYVPNGYAVTIAILNCSVHVIMYSYYLLASYGPRFQKIVAPIKPYITSIQIIQFLILIVYSLQAFIPGCPGARKSAAVSLFNLFANLSLFTNFFIKNYVKPKRTEKVQ